MRTKPTKYTKEFVLREVKSLLKDAESNQEMLWKGELFANKGYSRQRLSEWKGQFQRDRKISDIIGRIEYLLEGRIVSKSLKKELSPEMSKFVLVNHYDWKEKSETKIDATESFVEALRLAKQSRK